MRDANGGLRRIHLPGVGKNLQDRYEVTVVSELKSELATLDRVSFRPGDPNDLARQHFLEEPASGLYTTNGGTLAVIRRSSALKKGEPESDLFSSGRQPLSGGTIGIGRRNFSRGRSATRRKNGSCGAG